MVSYRPGVAIVRTLADLDELYEAPVAASLLKEVEHITPLHRAYIEASPFVVVASCGPGGLDCSPRGDPPGFVRVVDERTMHLPDRRGNNRLDTLRNLLENPEIALIFLLPGTNETARIAGTARLSTDPELLASMAVQGKEPKCAVVISVRQAYFHCAKALLRSKLWTGEYAQPKGTFPSISRMVGDQIGLSEEEKTKREALTERAYREGLWAHIS